MNKAKGTCKLFWKNIKRLTASVDKGEDNWGQLLYSICTGLMYT